MDHKIKQAKKIFDILEKEFTKDSREEIPYDIILNIIFVFLGIRPMTLFTIKTGSISKLLKTLFGSNPELKIISKKLENIPQINKKMENIKFINKEEIKKRGLTKELQQFIDGDQNHKLIGKLLGYACPIDIISEADNYYKLNDNELRRRFIISYNIYKKDNKKITLGPTNQLYAYICYSKDSFYKDALKRLKLYQKILAQLTDKLHIGIEFAEEII